MKKAEFLITYRCKTCGEQSSFADAQEAQCNYCDASTGLEEVDRQKITPELMEQQLKASAERMLANLQSAFENMTEDDKAAFGEKDAEKEMLLLLAKAKKFKDGIDKLNLNEPEDNKD
jgi:hypothetical protein